MISAINLGEVDDGIKDNHDVTCVISVIDISC